MRPCSFTLTFTFSATFTFADISTVAKVVARGSAFTQSPDSTCSIDDDGASGRAAFNVSPRSVSCVSIDE